MGFAFWSSITSYPRTRRYSCGVPSNTSFVSRFSYRNLPRSSGTVKPNTKTLSLTKKIQKKGESFCLKYDANSLLYISKAMDLFDMTETALKSLNIKSSYSTSSQDPNAHPQPMHKTSHSKSHPPPVNPPPYLSDLVAGMVPLSKTPTLVLGVQSDILFTIEQQREVADALRMTGNKNVSYYELGGVWGHDTFL